MTKPAKHKFTLYRGQTFRTRLTWRTSSGAPVDLTGCKVRMQVREDYESPLPLLELTSENGGIAIDPVEVGALQLYISDADTSAALWDGGVFDIEVVHPGGDVTRIVQGSVSVSPEVTRT